MGDTSHAHVQGSEMLNSCVVVEVGEGLGMDGKDCDGLSLITFRDNVFRLLHSEMEVKC